MRILVVGAGAIGGYFGGRLLEAGRDVTFLVRHRRAEQLAKTGLVIHSLHGDAKLLAPTVEADDLRGPFDLILMSCKAYDLPEAMDAFAPEAGPDTMILPLLNGIQQLELLERRFGSRAVLGGQCLISATLDDKGHVLHLNDSHDLTFGERDGSMTPRVDAIASALAGAEMQTRVSDTILQEMWDKWVFIATAAGITCLMRATIGDIVAAGAADLAVALLEECAAIAAAQGFPQRPAFLDRMRPIFTTPGSPLTASMLRDIERGAPIEADHILGDLLRRGERNDRSLLRIAHAHAKAYEARRAREQSACVAPSRTTKQEIRT